MDAWTVGMTVSYHKVFIWDLNSQKVAERRSEVLSFDGVAQTNLFGIHVAVSPPRISRTP